MPTASILDGTKKALGIDSESTDFDPDIIMHINATFSTLNQIGVGPATGYAIEDKEDLWSNYAQDLTIINFVKSYVYAKVRLLFDPPTTSFALDSLQKIANEFEWRLMVAADPKLLTTLEEEDLV